MDKAILIVAVVLVGCSAPVDTYVPPVGGGFVAPYTRVVDMYPEEVSAAVAEWEQTYGGTAACDPNVLRLVASSDPAVVLAECGRDISTIDGCRRDNTIVIAWDLGTYALERQIVSHEMLHWLSFCSGVYPDSQELHDDPAVWGVDANGMLGRLLAGLE